MDVRPRFADVIDELKVRFSHQAGSRASIIRDVTNNDSNNNSTCPTSSTIAQIRARKSSNILANSQSFQSNSQIKPYTSKSSAPGESSKRGYQRELNMSQSPPQSRKGSPKEDEPQSISSRYLFELVRRSSVGETTGLNDPWTNFSITQSEHQQFQEKIQSGSEEERLVGSFFENGFRYDWEPETGTMSVRTPTPLHEIFLSSVIEEILRQIKGFCEQDEAVSDIIGKIKDWGSPSLLLEPPDSSSQDLEVASKPITRSPDGSLYYQGSESRYPPAVFEVSCSEKRKDLPYIADSYIVDSQHDIRTVIGLDIGFTQPTSWSSPSKYFTHSGVSERKQDKGVSKLATISYWSSFQDIDGDGDCVGSSQRLLEDEAFRTPAGLPLAGSFEIPICALLPSEVTTSLPRDHALTELYVNISYVRLSEMLEEAEGIHEAIQQRKSEDIPIPKPTKWLKRKRTSQEVLSPGTEANCRGGGEGEGFAEGECPSGKRWSII